MRKLTDYIALLCLITLAGCEGFVSRTIIVDEFITIEFDSRGGAQCDNIRADYGAEVTLPAALRSGYVFLGWYSDAVQRERFGTAGDYYVARHSVTMYARWLEELYVDDRDSVINGIPAVLVRAGTFLMGCQYPEEEFECNFDEVQRWVTITRDYWISKYPVTNSQFGRAVTADKEKYPVVNVSWNEAAAFAADVGGLLPTEAQWEFAARGGNAGKNSGNIYSGSNNLDAVGWYDGSSEGEAQPIRKKHPNELGIYDMSGNVYEWCSDWYGFHTSAQVSDPAGRETRYETYGRVSRGGAWDSPARAARAADRAQSDPGIRADNLGFRVIWPVN